LIEFINENAYIMIALKGDSFCAAAREAYSLLRRNSAQILITDGLGKIFASLGKLAVAVAAAAVGHLLLV
jgi:choline transporter-like protein 2/4/5